MIQPEFEILLITMVVAVACALPGVFLVLRRMALMSDAISHSILLGIVLAFFVTGDVTSPLLILAAAATWRTNGSRRQFGARAPRCAWRQRRD
jgi:manganese/zinc/iron transport system permease protein